MPSIADTVAGYIDSAERRLRSWLHPEPVFEKPAALPDPPPPAAWLPSEVRARWGELCAAATPSDVPPELLGAVGWHESGHTMDPSVRHFDGHGRGVFGIDDRAHPEVSDQVARDFFLSAQWSAWYLSKLRGELEIDALANDCEPWKAALAAYNAGAGRVRQAWIEGKDVQAYTYNSNYVDLVWNWYQRFTNGELIS